MKFHPPPSSGSEISGSGECDRPTVGAAFPRSPELPTKEDRRREGIRAQPETSEGPGALAFVCFDGRSRGGRASCGQWAAVGSSGQHEQQP